MECVKKLKAALAAVPVSQPCTPADVAKLSAGARDASQQLFLMLSLTSPSLLMPTQPLITAVAEGCSWQQLPSACTPVLAWLADGLCSGLPAADHQEAYEMACLLLGVVSLVIPGSLEGRLFEENEATRQSARAAASRLVHTLGAFGASYNSDSKGLSSLLLCTASSPLAVMPWHM
jgi:hypothetical protein